MKIEIKIFPLDENVMVKTNYLLFVKRNVKTRWKVGWGKTARVEIRIMWTIAVKTVRCRLFKPLGVHTQVWMLDMKLENFIVTLLGFELAMTWSFFSVIPLSTLLLWTCSATTRCFSQQAFYFLFCFVSPPHIFSILELLHWLWKWSVTS